MQLKKIFTKIVSLQLILENEINRSSTKIYSLRCQLSFNEKENNEINIDSIPPMIVSFHSTNQQIMKILKKIFFVFSENLFISSDREKEKNILQPILIFGFIPREKQQT